MDGGAWWAAVHEVARVGHDFTFTFTFHFHALEKEMATHFSVLAWRIPGTGEPGGLLSMKSHRVGLRQLGSSSCSSSRHIPSSTRLRNLVAFSSGQCTILVIEQKTLNVEQTYSQIVKN